MCLSRPFKPITQLPRLSLYQQGVAMHMNKNYRKKIQDAEMVFFFVTDIFMEAVVMASPE